MFRLRICAYSSPWQFGQGCALFSASKNSCRNDPLKGNSYRINTLTSYQWHTSDENTTVSHNLCRLMHTSDISEGMVFLPIPQGCCRLQLGASSPASRRHVAEIFMRRHGSIIKRQRHILSLVASNNRPMIQFDPPSTMFACRRQSSEPVQGSRLSPILRQDNKKYHSLWEVLPREVPEMKWEKINEKSWCWVVSWVLTWV